jgi:hypothetical protein
MQSDKERLSVFEVWVDISSSHKRIEAMWSKKSESLRGEEASLLQLWWRILS